MIGEKHCSVYAEYEALEKKRIEINLKHAEAGVRFIDIKTVYIDEDVKIGAGTVIYPCVVIEGKTEIGKTCIIGQNTKIVNSSIGALISSCNLYFPIGIKPFLMFIP